MAYRRSITARSNLLYHHRLSPSISHSHRHHNVSENSEASPSPISRNPQVRNYIHHRFLLGAGNNFSNYRRFAVPAGYGMACGRNYWSEADKTEVLSEVVGVLGDKAPVFVFPPELVAATDSLPLVVAFQHLIDYVHCFTGFNWWASIAATTIIIRLLMLPLDIHRTKTKAEYSLVKPHWDAFFEELENKASSLHEDWVKWNALVKEYGASPLQHLKGLLISVPVYCSISFAIINMATKVPSFKEGGALWFTDLTYSCDFHLHMLTVAIYLSIEKHLRGGMKAFDPNILMLLGLAAYAAGLCPKATYFFWTTSGLFTMAYESAIKNPQVKKLLGLHLIVPAELPSTNHKSKKGGKLTGKKM